MATLIIFIFIFLSGKDEDEYFRGKQTKDQKLTCTKGQYPV
jgi:hypothetical protein